MIARFEPAKVHSLSSYASSYDLEINGFSDCVVQGSLWINIVFINDLVHYRRHRLRDPASEVMLSFVIY